MWTFAESLKQVRVGASVSLSLPAEQGDWLRYLVRELDLSWVMTEMVVYGKWRLPIPWPKVFATHEFFAV